MRKEFVFPRKGKSKMRKVIASEMISLDGFFAGPKGDLSWHVVDEEYRRFAVDLLNSADMLVFGRVTYELMVSYWPTETAVRDDPVVAEKMNTLPKIVFSRTISNVAWGKWGNARLAKEDLREAIAALKQEPGKDLLVLGSGQIVSALARAGLLDEYWLFVAPVVLGSGKPFFQDAHERVRFKLIETQQLRSGVVLLRYQRA
jgi:dihydrofolate reductase